MAHPDKEVLFSAKKKWAIKPWKEGGLWEISVPSSQFCYKSKSSLKKVFF